MPRTLDEIARHSLGANLKAAREQLGLSQRSAAAKAGLRFDRLNRWETGRETPGTEGLLTLAVAYGCPVDDLLGGVDEDYDAIIERRVPINVKRHYESKVDTFIQRTTAAMQLALTTQAPAPTPRARGAESKTSAETTTATRARRKRKK